MISMVSGLVSFAGTCVTALLAYQIAKLNREQRLRAESTEIKVDAVARDLRVSNVATTQQLHSAVVKADEIKQELVAGNVAGARERGELATVAKASHALINNNMAVQLRMTANALRSLANLTKSPEDLEHARDAEKALADHLAGQETVDRQPGSDDQKKGNA